MNKKIIVAPSLLAADFSKLKEEIQEVENYGAEYLHLDVMDGTFVPNISFGVPIISSLKKHSNLIFDVHLMVENPDRFIKDFVDAGADIITVHAESTKHLNRTIQLIKSYGKKVGVSLNPSTSLDVIKYDLKYLDMVLIMTVNPGFGGQNFIDSMIDKIKELRYIAPNIDIEVDGGINEQTGKKVKEAGANILVAGSYIFSGNYKEKIESLLDEFYKTYYKIEEINLSQVIKCLTTTELHVIEAIGEESLTMNELSDRLGITMGTASVAVNKLTEKYFIERNRSDEDRRKVYVQLSKKGLLAYKYHVSFHSNILEKVTTDIKKEKLDTFVEVFQTIVHNLNKIKKDIQPESILNFEKGDIVQVSSIKGSPAIRKYLNEKGISIKSLIKILDINKHIIMLLVDGDEKIISIEDATDIMVTRNYV